MLLLLLSLQATLTSQANLPATKAPVQPYDESECGVYPSCSQYGVGVWQILEDCHRYINCTRPEGGGDLVQHNMECPGDLVFANEYNECVEWDKATECKTFQETPCLLSCPRVFLDSTGPGQEYQERRTGCFRISGTLFGGTMVHYQNENRQYLTPDASSNPMSIHWIVSEGPGAFNGGIRNIRVDYIKCPFDDWNFGWEVDQGLGHWVEDETMRVRCHKGDEGASTDWTPVPTTGQPTSVPPSPCHHNGPNVVENCSPDFMCCNWDSLEKEWVEKTCHCLNDNVFDMDFETCSWPDFCGMKGHLPWEVRADHICDDGNTCDGA